MEVKHQVFVSSTYKDLIEERQHVIHALLELDCIPAGMELFPATDEDAWSLIKEVIDGCDYYMVILAGKYGSTGSTGTSYTEMEYDYALESGKPIIGFIHENIEDLKSSKVEKHSELIEKLNAFKEKVKKKHCKFYTSAEDLGGKVSRSLIQLKKKHPSNGWVPGVYAMTDEIKREYEAMRAKIAELELEIIKSEEIKDLDTSNLAKGSESLEISQEYDISTWNDPEPKIISDTVEITWDELFSYIATDLQGEGSEADIKKKIKLAIYHKLTQEVHDEINFGKIYVPIVVFDKIKVQFQALGLIEPGTKRRSVSDTNTYWKITKKGERQLLNMRAVKTSKPIKAEEAS